MSEENNGRPPAPSARPMQRPIQRKEAPVKNEAIDPSTIRRAAPINEDEIDDSDSLFKDASGRPIDVDGTISKANRLAVTPCTYFDAQKQHCKYLGIHAKPMPTQEGRLACFRQSPRWLGRSLPCKVPELVQAQDYKGEYYLHDKLRAAAINVLNAIALEDRCPHGKTVERGPLCNTMAVACVRPGDHRNCEVYRVLDTLGGVVRGRQEKAIVQQAYDRETGALTGQHVDRANPHHLQKDEHGR